MSNIISFLRTGLRGKAQRRTALQKVALSAAVCGLVCVLCGAGSVGEIAASYVDTPFYVSGAPAGHVLTRDGVDYIAAADFFTAFDPTLTVIESGSDRVDVMGHGLELCAVAGQPYLEVNGRCIWAGTIPSRSGRVLLPLETLCAAFGVVAEYDAGADLIGVETDRLTPPESGETYYDEDDLYWLSRLISSEAGGEPLDGKIAVGNVVLNRAASEAFPDTVVDVVFDDAYGIQFSVVPAGTIYKEPNIESVAAAKLCLEGVNNIGDALYFVNPQIGSSSWFAKTRTFVTTIEGHDFYA